MNEVRGAFCLGIVWCLITGTALAITFAEVRRPEAKWWMHFTNGAWVTLLFTSGIAVFAKFM